MTRGARLRFGGYVALVVITGLAVVLNAVADLQVDLLAAHPVAFGLLSLAVLVGELVPLPVSRHGDDEEITTSTTFAFAMLLSLGAAPAILMLAGSSVVADLRRRKPLSRILFNLSQFAICLHLAGLAIGDRLTLADQSASGDDVARIAASALIFFLTNNILIGVVIGFASGNVLPYLVREFKFHTATAGVLLGLGPVVVLIADTTPLLLPFLLLPVVGVYQSARVSAEKEHQALHDELTGLPNRARFQRSVLKLLAEPQDEKLAIMLIDLDRFKEVNDTLGHHTGDRLLAQVGPRLAERVEGLAVIARLGGDEFAVATMVAGPEEAEIVAQRITDALVEPFRVDGLRLDIEASIGIAMHPQHGNEVDVLLQRADVAMYLAKEHHTPYEVYTSERDQNSRRRLRLLGELRDAITDRRLHLVYQPQANARTGEVVGVEALVRWDHPELGPVTPNEFVPLAEHTGMIEPMTQFILDEAIAQNRLWLMEGRSLRVSVNLSARSLHDLSLPAQIADLLAHYEVPAENLVIELTESTLMSDPKRAYRVLSAISSTGVRIAIDDFGTGYSSLAYLRLLPVSEIKIDRSFVAGITESENDSIIVRSTIEMAKNLGLETLAEGVEDAAVLELLRDLGCDLAQGYYVSRPLVGSRVVPWLEERAVQAVWADRAEVEHDVPAVGRMTEWTPALTSNAMSLPHSTPSVSPTS